jgi:hypothetical protein
MSGTPQSCVPPMRTPALPSESGEEADGKTMLRLSFGDFLAHAALTVSGHLRRRPDPACESALRAAFAELDAELAVILGNRAVPHSLR